MRKNLLLCLMLLCATFMFAGTAPAGTDLYTTDGYKVMVLEDGSVAITWIYNEGEVTIPSEVTDNAENSTGTYKVSKVGATWTICDNNKITKLMLSEGITSVGLSAFWGMSSITSLSLPSTLTSIEGYAFGDCTGLKEITSNAKIAPTLGEDVFKTSASSGMDWNYIGLNCKLIVPEGCAANYQGTSTWTYWDAFANVEEVVSVETLTTAASGFATYAASYPVNYKELGLTAYAIALDEAAQKVAYQEIEGVVPANTPVLVKGEASRGYSLAKAADDAVAVSTDLLVSDGNMVAENGLYYVFATVEGKSGFKILADGLTIPTKKCYLKLSESNAKSFFEIGTEATGISLEKTAIAAKNGVLYNLAGVRVPETAKGVLVRNGKKFVNK